MSTGTIAQLDLSAVAPDEPNPDARKHIQVAVWFSAHPDLPRTNVDGLRTVFHGGSVADDKQHVDEVGHYLGVEPETHGDLYSVKVKIVAGICYEAFCWLHAEADPPVVLADARAFEAAAA